MSSPTPCRAAIELTDVRPDEPATITVDTYPGREWRGTVASIGPAAQSEFSLLPAQNTSGNWVKVELPEPLELMDTLPCTPTGKVPKGLLI